MRVTAQQVGFATGNCLEETGRAEERGVSDHVIHATGDGAADATWFIVPRIDLTDVVASSAANDAEAGLRAQHVTDTAANSTTNIFLVRGSLNSVGQVGEGQQIATRLKDLRRTGSAADDGGGNSAAADEVAFPAPDKIRARDSGHQSQRRRTSDSELERLIVGGAEKIDVRLRAAVATDVPVA